MPLGFVGLRVPIIPILAEVGESTIVMREAILPAPDQKARPKFSKRLNTNIIPLPLFPGIQSGDLLQSLVDLKPDALVLHGYGTGNAPTNGNFIPALASCNANDRRTHILDVSQCLAGHVNLGNYETSAQLLELGVLAGADITPEAALTKLMVLLADEDKAFEDIQIDVQKSLAGEQSESIYSVVLPDTSGKLECKKNDLSPAVRMPGKVAAPSNWKKELITSAYLRMWGVRYETPKDDVDTHPFSIEISAYHDVSSDEIDDIPNSHRIGDPIIRNTSYLGTMLFFDISTLIQEEKIKAGETGTSFTFKLGKGHAGFELAWDKLEIVIFEHVV